MTFVPDEPPSEHTRLLLTEQSFLLQDGPNEASTTKSSVTIRMDAIRGGFTSGVLLLLLACSSSSYYYYYYNNYTSPSTVHPTATSETTMMEWMQHWDQWGKQQQQPYDLWGAKHSDDTPNSPEESNPSTTDGEFELNGTDDKHKNIGKDHDNRRSSSSSSSNSPPPKTSTDATPPNVHHAQEWMQDTWKNASSEAQQWWHDTSNGNHTTPMLQQTQDWFHHAWNQTAQQAHAVWTNMQETKDDPAIRVWWNETVHNEHQWWNQTLGHLHHLGTTVQSWWGQAAEQTQEEERVLGHQFQLWWEQASQVEQQWWRETVHASKRFERVAQQKTGLWWEATRAATGKHWNYTVHEERVWWNATERWFHDHPLVDDSSSSEQPLLYLNSSQAYSMLMNGYGWYDYSSDFFLYQSGWDAQINQAYCAVASSAALLNSMRALLNSDGLSLPVDPIYDPHPYATQTDLLQTGCVHDNVVRCDATLNGILQFPGGLNLLQAQQLLECHLDSSTWDVSIFHVNPFDTTTDQVRRDLQSALKDPSARVLINFDRRGLGQEGGGHFSPLGSYSPQHDAFLIMDVAKYKYPPVWVPAARLVAAMGTIDTCGMWDFPEQQDRLADKDLLRPESSRSYEKARGILGCEERFRGYLIVRLKVE